MPVLSGESRKPWSSGEVEEDTDRGCWRDGGLYTLLVLYSLYWVLRGGVGRLGGGVGVVGPTCAMIGWPVLSTMVPGGVG